MSSTCSLGRSNQLRQLAGEYADAARVLARDVVARLRRHRESLEHLDARRGERVGPLLHARLERPVLVAEPRVQRAQREQVAHAQQDFRRVERLGDEIRRAGIERVALDLATTGRP